MKTNDAWEQLFQEYNIPEEVRLNGFFEITATQIRKYREPRLMAKFDHERSLPPIFKQYNLTILPITNEKYVIGPFKIFHSLDKTETEIKYLYTPGYITTIDFNNIPSEAIALNAAYIIGILQDFVEDDFLYPTISGRMRTPEFTHYIDTFDCNNCQIMIKGIQIEIDGSYEGEESFNIIEAKNVVADDFVVRQLYYPYRTWMNKVNKKINLIFFTYSNSIFDLYKYEFLNPEDYSSIHLTQHKRYSLERTNISLDDILDAYNNSYIESEPQDIPFPQADDFKKVINILEWCQEPQDNDTLLENLDVAYRQVNYYTSAGKYLGLLHSEKRITWASAYGKTLLKMDYYNRNIELVKRILSHEPFRVIFDYIIENGEIDNKTMLEILFRTPSYFAGTEITRKRRASTVRGWMEWIFSLINSD